MTPREKALNELIKYSNGQKIYSIHPSKLKIDFIPVWYRERMELGIAYLNKRIKRKYIPSNLSDKLDHIQLLISNQILKIEDITVDIMGIEDEDYSKYLWFNDGIHRTITVLSTLEKEERYFDVTIATPVENLRKKVKEKYKKRPKTKKELNWKKVFKWRKTEFEKLIINEEPAKIGLFNDVTNETGRAE